MKEEQKAGWVKRDDKLNPYKNLTPILGKHDTFYLYEEGGSWNQFCNFGYIAFCTEEGAYDLQETTPLLDTLNQKQETMNQQNNTHDKERKQKILYKHADNWEGFKVHYNRTEGAILNAMEEYALLRVNER